MTCTGSGAHHIHGGEHAARIDAGIKYACQHTRSIALVHRTKRRKAWAAYEERWPYCE
jgi:hypothetical protein